MKVLDPGHSYELNILDYSAGKPKQPFLIFVKRLGPKFPGNTGEAYPGTTLQEVLRACCDRLRYVSEQGALLEQPQMACNYSTEALGHLRQAILCLERRAALLHGRGALELSLDLAESGQTCSKCNHVGCKGDCH